MGSALAERSEELLGRDTVHVGVLVVHAHARRWRVPRTSLPVAFCEESDGGNDARHSEREDKRDQND